MAIASANTSRPQPFVLESGVMKKPSDDRGPKLRTEMLHAHSTRTTGVRQVSERAATGLIEVIRISAERRYRAVRGAAMYPGAGLASHRRMASTGQWTSV